MDVKVCTCIHCRNRKKTMKRNAKRIFRRLISKKRRAESSQSIQFSLFIKPKHMNLVQSANERKRQEAAKAEHEARMNAHIGQERMNIRVNLIQAAKEPEKAKAAWNLIRVKDYPEITLYGQAAFVMLKNDEVPTVEKLDVIAEYFKQD